MKWSKEDDRLLKKLVDDDGLSYAETSKVLNRSLDATYNRYQRLNAGHALDEIYKDNEAKIWKEKYRSLSKLKAVEERMLEHFTETVKPFTPKLKQVPKRKATGKKEAAVLLLSDSHVGLVVKKEQTFGIGNYNPKVFLDRLSFLEQSTISILADKLGETIDSLHIVVNGDLVEGKLNHSNEKSDNILLAHQVELATWSFSQFFIRLSLALQIPIHIHMADVGNHGRWMDQRKMPTANRFSNFDYLVYSSIAAVLHASQIKNLFVYLDEQPGSLFDIKGTTFFAKHGDTVRGSGSILNVPLLSMAKDVISTTLRHEATSKPKVDTFLLGHHHHAIEVGLPDGAYVINGGWVGLDNYALASNFIYAPPMQLLFGVHEKFRRTWSYQIQLKYAPKLEVLPYDLPEGVVSLLDTYES